MPNSDPQAVKVANEQLRPFADVALDFYTALKNGQALAVGQGWSALFPGGADTIIEDGSAIDGRTPITDADAAALITFLGTFITQFEANSFANRNLVAKIAVNPRR